MEIVITPNTTFHLDRANPDILRDEIARYDHALTRPWSVIEKYRGERV